VIQDNVIRSSRAFPVSRNALFQAFAEPNLLKLWWGPKGFTNTFEQFSFEPGGHWIFTMHSPEGKDFPNHSVFDEIAAPAKIRFRHICKPEFCMTMYFEGTEENSVLTWEMEFENAEMKNSLEKLVVPSNEQNFDRLEKVLETGLKAQPPDF